MRPWLIVAAWWLIGCDPEVQFPGGTTTRMQTRKVGGTTVLVGTGSLASFDVDRCAPTRDGSIAVGEVVDLLGSGPFGIPGGDWCVVEVVFDAPLHYEGIAGDGSDPGKGTFTLDLDVPRVSIPVVRDVYVEGWAFVVELGHREWAEAEKLGGLEDGTHIDVDPASPLHDDLADAIAYGSAVYVDADEDGELDGAERTNPVGTGPEYEEEDE
jgi:hypothetical protein